MFDVLILLFAIVLFTVLAFKRVGALPMAGIVALITCILAQMPVLDTMLGPFMESAANYVKNYFFIFFLGAVFSAFYEGSGAAKSIARFLSRLTGGKHVAVLVFIIASILTFGGISGFVVYFVMYPITLQLFQKNDMSRILIPASITAGCWTISMIAPGSPSIQNVIGMKSLGTTATAAFVPGVISVIAELILIIIWFEYRTKALEKKGRRFDDPTLPPLPEEEKNFADDPNERMPHWIVAFIPIAVILILFNGFKMAVEGAVFWGIVAACILFFPYLKRFETYVELLNRGGVNAGGALLNTAIVVGFGGVAQNTEGFRIRLRRYGRGLQRPQGHLCLPGRQSGVRPPYRRHRRRHAGYPASPGRPDHHPGHHPYEPQDCLSGHLRDSAHYPPYHGICGYHPLVRHGAVTYNIKVYKIRKGAYVWRSMI